MEKRTLMALALSFLILGFYPVILQKFYPDYGKPKVTTALAPEAVSTQGVVRETAPRSTEPARLLASRDVALSTPTLRLLFNPADGGIREVNFLKFYNPDTEGPLQLFSVDHAGWSALALTVPGVAPEAIKSDVRVSGLSAIVTSTVSDKFRATKTILFSDAYSAEVSLKLENLTSEALRVSYELNAGPSFPPRNNIDQQYTEANFFSKALKHIKETKAGKSVSSAGPVEWVATKDRHFSVIVKPHGATAHTGLVRGLGDHHFLASAVSPTLSLPAKGSVQEEYLVFVGPNDPDVLAPLGLDTIISFGKLDAIGKVLVGGLELLHKAFKNYGVAIIVLTMLINLILFPLTRASYLSMKRMQLIQPQMSKLKEQNKKNPEKLNREMMELYKKHKVNPFGGCLPMLMQMPVFLALYVALSKSVSLMHAKFLWVKDLSSPDKVPLPFTLPVIGDSIHALPLIMIAAMVVQQRFTQIKMEGQDPAMEAQQRMMAVMMPLLFGFLFYSMPSGLVLYWLTNTVLMSLYQLRLKNVTLAS